MSKQKTESYSYKMLPSMSVAEMYSAGAAIAKHFGDDVLDIRVKMRFVIIVIKAQPKPESSREAESGLYRALAKCETKARQCADCHEELIELQTDYAKSERARFSSWSDEHWHEHHRRELEEARAAQHWLFVQQMIINPD